MLRRIKVDKDIERKITIAFIVSDLFCKKIRTAYKPEYMEVDYVRTIIGWVIEYFDYYTKAPGIHIQDIYDIEKHSLKEAESNIVAVFLADISDEYAKESVINVDYWVDQARLYFRKRSLEILFDTGNKLTSIGKVDEAEKLLLEHKKVSKITSGRFDPFDVSVIRNHQHSSDANRMFKLPGALGNLVGWFERGWLVALMAPEKRGKSWLLEEVLFAALMARHKVFWGSLEMPQNILERRIYQKLTAHDIEESRGCDYPVFDCMSNQDNSCTKKIRTCLEGVYDGDRIMNFDKNSTYKPCTLCRGEKSKSDYIPAYWKKHTKTEQIKTKIIEKKVKGFAAMFGRNLRVKAYPRFSASIDDIINELDDLEYSEGFVPDVVAIDYFDILMPSRRYSDGRDQTNSTWMMGSRIAGERNCLVVTADQSDAAGRNQRSLNTSNFSEDKRKDAHLDVRIALNQLPPEKKDKVARVGVLFHRHNEYYIEKEVMILQELSLGQPMLDSENWNKKYDRRRADERD